MMIKNVKLTPLVIALGFGFIPMSYVSAADLISLDGQSLTMESLSKSKVKGAKVSLTKSAQKRIDDSFDFLIDAAKKGTPVYGLTVGVGKNKDTPVFNKSGRLTSEAKKISEAFNRDMLYTSAAASGDPIDPEIVKMSMVIRLNQIANGHVGVSPAVAKAYEDFINHDIIPVVPEDGSIGLSDIMLASHIGAAMMGDWDVFYKGQRVPALKAMKAEGLKPLVPFGKDGLSLLSNNALATAQLVVGVNKAKQLIDFSPKLLAFGLEAINGNISPILPHTVGARPMPHVQDVASDILKNLEGGYLFERDEDRPLQDSLSYRGSHWGVAHARYQYEQIKTLIDIQVNSSDDNPTVYVDAKPSKYNQYPQVSQYFTSGDLSGAINSSANFDTTQLASQAEGFINAMGQLAKYSSNRQIRIINPYFTGLPRALVDPDHANSMAFYTLQNGFTALYAEIAHAANPVSFYGITNQGGIEDHFSNFFQVGQNLNLVVDKLAVIYGFELMQDAQALEQRKKIQHRTLSSNNEKMLKSLRKVLPYYGKDRIFTPDVKVSTKFLINYK
ncbi:aromatic amino acid ammonia-lyase [Shewanella abyssi]|uniref:HAL/PAL/TAL family ammonia-lyase n=1 Tax=Shewanella abyssi TaxID=311789 RepID=UPI00200BF1F5|nr:aromatic amino acid ammonia-lyase [Shewanella abyssi]MCL1051312.1 aromatic amino acid ammonia-lyase [Shewanella abyssi]